MAVATAARFCGRCGAPLAPGARFCGRCGTPVLAAAPAAPPLYRYAPAPPATYPRSQTRLGPVLIAGGLIAILVVAGLVVGGIAVAQFARSGGGHATCTSNCPPKFVTPLPEDASFTSTTYGFTVNYSSRWTVRDQAPDGVTLGTHLGQVQVNGSKGSSPDQAMQAVVATLPTAKWQDVTVVTPALHGAHIGDVQGVGAVYSANLIGASQTAAKVRLAVIAATRDGVTVVVIAVDPADPKGSPNGFPEAQLVDYLCTEFLWKGEG
jgi:hypothetical protein